MMVERGTTNGRGTTGATTSEVGGRGGSRTAHVSVSGGGAFPGALSAPPPPHAATPATNTALRKRLGTSGSLAKNASRAPVDAV